MDGECKLTCAAQSSWLAVLTSSNPKLQVALEACIVARFRQISFQHLRKEPFPTLDCGKFACYTRLNQIGPPQKVNYPENPVGGFNTREININSRHASDITHYRGTPHHEDATLDIIRRGRHGSAGTLGRKPSNRDMRLIDLELYTPLNWDVDLVAFWF